jgi:hypothetical protein
MLQLISRTVGHTVLKLSQCLHRRVAEKPTLTRRGVCGVCHQPEIPIYYQEIIGEFSHFPLYSVTSVYSSGMNTQYL